MSIRKMAICMSISKTPLVGSSIRVSLINFNQSMHSSHLRNATNLASNAPAAKVLRITTGPKAKGANIEIIAGIHTTD